MKKELNVIIKTDHITLGSFLKYQGIVSQGSDVKTFILENDIFIDGILENRRGRKIYPNSKIMIDNFVFIIKK